MEQPKVTVVIPIYNVEKYLDRCVESIVSQTYENLEILLIDDGSPDRCPQMCEEWAKRDSRITVIHKTNAGLGMARNTGIENATGEYICFFDSDDYVDHRIIQKCILSALENRSDVVIFGYANVFEDGRVENMKMKLPRTVFKDEQICDQLLPGMYTYDMGFGISAWGKLFRLGSIVENNLRFKSEREIISEDAFFALEYYPKVRTVSIVNQPLYFYYKRGDSLSRGYKKERQHKNDEFIRVSLDYIAQENLSNNVKSHIVARYHMYTAATIKQLLVSGISPKNKKQELDDILRSETLRKTVSCKVLRLHKAKLAVLLLFIKLKMYLLCKWFINLMK